MNTNLLETQALRIENIRIMLANEEKEFLHLKESIKQTTTPNIEPVVTPSFTKRQLEFRRDDAQPLVNKYKNKKYVIYKPEILDELKTKFERAKKRKEKIDKVYLIFEKFFEELNNETRIELKNDPRVELKNEPSIHIKN